MGRVFVNLEDKNLIGVIDIATHQKIAEWPWRRRPTGHGHRSTVEASVVGGGSSGGNGLHDRQGRRQRDDLQGHRRHLDYGTSLRPIFNSCSDGHITISHIDGPEKITVVATLPTARGARTMAYDPSSRRIYTAAPNYAPADPAAGANARPAAIPESFHVLVFDVKH